jgi:histidinol phosphatase-like enzyme (inositol monophosphatase family)
MEEFKEFAQLLASESAKIINKYYRSDYHVETKKDLSPVTIADKLAEQKMRDLIIKNYPDHGIWGEEFGKYKEDSRYQWVLDPIDGTKSFIHGMPIFGTLIALLEDGLPILGLANYPPLNEQIIGDNNATYLNNKKVSVSKTEKLQNALLLTTDIVYIEKHQNIDKFRNLINKVKLFRTWGDCYGYYLVARGFADIMVDPKMAPWDIMALIPIIKGAGGIITDYQGRNPIKGNSIIAATPALHQQVVKLLNP